MSIKANSLVSKAYDKVEQGNFADAVSLLERAVELAPENDEIRSYLGEAYILNSQYEKAMEAFAARDQILLQAHPLTPYIEGYRGRVLLERGNIAEAKELLDKAIGEDAKEPEIMYSLALIHMLEKNSAQVRQTLRKVDALDPTFYYRKIRHLLSQIDASEADKTPENPTETTQNDS